MKSEPNVVQIESYRLRRHRKAGDGRRGGSTGDFVGKGVSDADMRALTGHFAAPTDEAGLRNRALFLIMSRTGLRAAEVVSLRWSALVTLPEGLQGFRVRVKGGKDHIVVPGPEAIAAAREYHLKAAIVSDFLFYSLPLRNRSGERNILTTRGLQKVVNGWGVKTGQGRLIHPHSLRHTAVQKAFDLGGTLAAQKLAGHSSPAVTGKHYTRPYHDCSTLLTWT